MNCLRRPPPAEPLCALLLLCGLTMAVEFGPLPEPSFSLDGGTLPCYTADQMRAYALAEVLKERELCAADYSRLMEKHNNLHLKAHKYREVLRIIARMDPSDTEEGYNEWGEAKCFKIAKEFANSLFSPPPAAE